MRKLLIGLLIVLLIAVEAVLALPSLLDRKMNSVEVPPLTPPARRPSNCINSCLSRTCMTMYCSEDETDNITLLAMAQRWPRETWNSLLQRALYQAHKLNEASANSDGRLVLIKNRSDLARFVSAWQQDPQRVAAILATEGLQPIEGKLENVDALYQAGFVSLA